jgi:hypothetical protein
MQEAFLGFLFRFWWHLKEKGITLGPWTRIGALSLLRCMVESQRFRFRPECGFQVDCGSNAVRTAAKTLMSSRQAALCGLSPTMRAGRWSVVLVVLMWECERSEAGSRGVIFSDPSWIRSFLSCRF